MKKIFTIAMCLLAAVLISIPSYSQKKKKETSKERKERIAKITNDGAAKKDLFIFITRSFNKNNNFNFNYNTISAATAEFYVDLKRDRISCCLPFTGLADSKSRQAYSLSNTDISIIANNQITTIFGGWSEKQKSYMFQSIFWNNDSDTDSQAIQVTMTLQVYPSGKVYIMVEVPGFESVSYEGEVDNRPYPDDPNPLTE
ncbi:MAG: hypothetical protein IKS82_00910 [Bacteroidales bacterium]|nr:hypothetical protein [Bacteroidales bacterium]